MHAAEYIYVYNLYICTYVCTYAYVYYIYVYIYMYLLRHRNMSILQEIDIWRHVEICVFPTSFPEDPGKQIPEKQIRFQRRLQGYLTLLNVEDVFMHILDAGIFKHALDASIFMQCSHFLLCFVVLWLQPWTSFGRLHKSFTECVFMQFQ